VSDKKSDEKQDSNSNGADDEDKPFEKPARPTRPGENLIEYQPDRDEAKKLLENTDLTDEEKQVLLDSLEEDGVKEDSNKVKIDTGTDEETNSTTKDVNSEDPISLYGEISLMFGVDGSLFNVDFSDPNEGKEPLYCSLDIVTNTFIQGDIDQCSTAYNSATRTIEYIIKIFGEGS